MNSSLRGGIFVGAGDVDGDGLADIVTGGGVGTTPQVSIFDAMTGIARRSFLAYDPRFTGGVGLAVRDGDEDGHADIVTAPGVGGGPHIRVFNGVTDTESEALSAFDSAFRGGVFVG